MRKKQKQYKKAKQVDEPQSILNDPVLSLDQLAASFGVSRSTVKTWTPYLVKIRPGRYLLSSAVKYHDALHAPDVTLFKAAQLDKANAETRRLEETLKQDRLKTEQMRQEILTPLCEEDRQAVKLHFALLHRTAKFAADFIDDFLTKFTAEIVRRVQAGESTDDIDTHSIGINLVNVVIRFVFGNSATMGMPDYRQGSLRGLLRMDQSDADVFDPWKPHSVAPVFQHEKKSDPDYCGGFQLVPYTTKEREEQMQQLHFDKGGRWIRLDLPAPTNSPVLLLARLASLVENGADIVDHREGAKKRRGRT